MMKLILASGSEWRKELLAWLELPFEVVESGVEEAIYQDEEASEAVARLALSKAETVMKKMADLRLKLEGAMVVVGADTVINVGNQIIGKPADRGEAKRIIQQLAGKTHEVWTGLAVIDDLEDRRVEVEKTLVTFKPMTEAEVEKYLDTREWEGKAGGYQVQGAISKHIIDIQGSYTNVIGLPLLVIQDTLESLGGGVGVDVAEVIRGKTGYES
jgi:septum formation protein